jgi:peroxiredoxin
VIGVSVDPDTTLAAWARESSYPGLFLSDSGQVIGKLYGAAKGAIDQRYLFVIGPDGRITYRSMPFNVMSQDAYAELAKAVDQTAGAPPPP